MPPFAADRRQATYTRRFCLQGVAALATSVCLPARASAQVEPWPLAQRLPELQALDLEGKPWRLPPPGRAFALNFWASWCEPCRTEMPTLQQLADLYGDKLTVAALNFKERAVAVQRFARNAGISMPVLLDPAGDIARAYGVKVFPSTILFAPDGRPRWRVQGEMDWTGSEAGRLVEGLWR